MYKYLGGLGITWWIIVNSIERTTLIIALIIKLGDWVGWRIIGKLV